MSAAHDFELPPHAGAPVEAVDAAVDGDVVYLTRDGETIAVIVPPAALEALEDAEDIRAAQAARDEGGNPIPAEQLWAEIGL